MADNPSPLCDEIIFGFRNFVVFTNETELTKGNLLKTQSDLFHRYGLIYREPIQSKLMLKLLCLYKHS